MIEDTRTRILLQALELFNVSGIHNVSLRDIAAALDISVGNLTYHFKKREDIIKELYFGFFELLSTRRRAERMTPSQILETLMSPDEAQIVLALDYRFIIFDHHVLMEDYPEIKRHFNLVFEQRENGLEAVFRYLASNGLMREPIRPDEYKLLARRQVMLGYFWMNHPEVDRSHITLEDFREIFEMLKSGLEPYLLQPEDKQE